ncbi:putative beta-lysine N-acetyltransferase [Sutcliffiella horikoshii]|uniref:Putative beta-lysine N-acetyltransferase n=1 Tax=Sutcliffiella horikoshii TaxID=79883 RepID=A0A5D4TIU7_9BACI|nr:putative beta-lysine N-acetyltransferase [Sutcliffiella horikoshii]TYS74748.1 putative beta-lysine N-acetyltransferase [Sutcliffiella horikoshii]
MSTKTGKALRIKNQAIYVDAYEDYYNKRLKVDDFRGNIKQIIETIEEWSKQPFVEKVIIKSRPEHLSTLMERGFLLEASVPGYFLGGDGYFLCKYRKVDRYNSDRWCEEDSILDTVWQKKNQKDVMLDSNLTLRVAKISDAQALSQFYKDVFPIYPVPIEDPNFIMEQMESNTFFMLLEEKGEIIAAASAEMNKTYRNAEITDCATSPSKRKGGYMNTLIRELEAELVKKQIYCSYSIARALSFGMNAVLHNLDYTYKGRLKNNCYIFDKIEDMNVWSKDLSLMNAQKPAPNAEK